MRVFSMFDVDDRVRGFVLTESGKVFSAGADLDIGFISQRKRSVKGSIETGS